MKKREYKDRDTFIKQRSKKQKELWKDPEYRRKLMESKARKGTYTNKERNKAQSKLMRKLWANNKYKKRQMKTRKTLECKEHHYKGAIKSLVEGTAVVNSFGGKPIITIKGGEILCHGNKGLEKKIALFLDTVKEVRSFKKDAVKVMYTVDGKERIYFPDFFVTTKRKRIVVIEILSHPFGNTRKEKAKIYAVQKLCKKKGWRFLLVEIVSKKDIKTAKQFIKRVLKEEDKRGKEKV